MTAEELDAATAQVIAECDGDPQAAVKTELLPIIRANANLKTHVMSDEIASSQHLGCECGHHASVNHAKDEYVRYTNAAIFRFLQRVQKRWSALIAPLSA